MYEDLYRENKGLIWFFAQRYTPNANADRDDLVQAGFFGLIDAAETYQEECGSWATWAGLHIRREMRKALGLHGKRQVETVSLDTPLEEDGDTLGDIIEDKSAVALDAALLRKEMLESVQKAVNGISAELPRKAIKMVYFDGMTRRQAARCLGVRVGKVPGILERGKEELRRNHRLRRELDAETRFHAKKGVESFMRDRTSVVEEAVIWRDETLRNKMREKGGF